MGDGVRWLAVVVGTIRLASGASFLVAPLATNRMWGDPADPGPTGRILLRSMGYRDALVGVGLLRAARRRDARAVAGWLLASAGADAADLVGGLAVHDTLPRAQRRAGLGGAAAGIVVGVAGALWARSSARR